MPEPFTERKNGAELLRLKEVAWTPAVGDNLDVPGCCHQFLPQPVQPSLHRMKVAGRAMPMVMALKFEAGVVPPVDGGASIGF